MPRGSSNLSGQSGALDFTFNPANALSPSAYVDIFDFQSGGTLAGSPYNFSDPIPAVLPGNTLTFHNDVNNDYFDGFTFGTYIHFGVRFYGPALTSPDGSPYGTSFLFTVYSDPDGANPALGTGVNQAAFSAEIFGDGTVSTVQSDFVTLSGAGTPEPGGMALMAAPLLGLWLWRRRRVQVR